MINTVLPWPPVTIVEEYEDGILYQTGEKDDKYCLILITKDASFKHQNLRLFSTHFAGLEGEQFAIMKQVTRLTMITFEIISKYWNKPTCPADSWIYCQVRPAKR